MTSTALAPPKTANPALATRLTLIATGLMTVLAGATVAPAIPEIREVFADHAGVGILSGMVLSTHAIAIVIFAPLAGLLADRWGRKQTLLTGLVLIALGGTSGAWLPTLETILVGRFVLGIGVALVMTSATTLIADLFDGEARQKLIGQQLAASTVGGMAFILGGGALATLEWRATFLIYLAAVVLVVATAFAVPPVRPEPGEAVRPGKDGEVKLGVIVLAPLGAALLGQVIFYIVPTQIPTFVAEEFGFNPFQAGLVLTTTMFTSLPIALNFHRIRRHFSPATLTALAFALMGAGLAGVSASTEVWAVVASLVVMALGLSALMPNLNSWMAAVADAPVRGRAMGLLGAMLSGGQFLSPLLTQPVIDRIGLQPAIGAVAALAAVVAAVYLALRPRLASELR